MAEKEKPKPESPPRHTDAELQPAGAATRGRGARAPAAIWVSSTYFAEGFPYGVVNGLAEILFKELGASLQVIGLTTLFHLPWNLKFLWSPFLDRYATKRRWLVASEVAVAVGLVALALLAGASRSLPALAALFFVVAVLSATHDIAIDGYYLEALDERGQSAYVGYRAMAYKVAALVVGGPLLILTGGTGWRVGLAVAAAAMAALAAFHLALLPDVERPGLPARDLLRAVLRRRGLLVVAAATLVAWVLRDAVTGDGSPGAALVALAGAAIGAVVLPGGIGAAGWTGIGLLAVLLAALAALPRLRTALARRDSPYARAFVDFLAQRQVGRVLAFVVLYRLGESFLVKMRWPFLRDDVGMTLDQYGLANGTLGIVASFAATFLGGWLIARDGLRRWIWPFVLAQNVLNLLFAWLAGLDRPADLGFAAVTAVIAVEQFGAGLGTAVFMVYLMRCCDPAHRAAHMAILTALMSVGFTLAGVASGFLAEALGFARYFSLSFLATIPSMALVFFLPHLDGREA